MPMICSSDLATMKWLNLQNNGKFLPRAVIETRAHYQPDLLHLLELCLGPAKVGGLAAKPGSAKRTNTTSVLGNHTSAIITGICEWVFCQVHCRAYRQHYPPWRL